MWDCPPESKKTARGCCIVADFHAPFSTHLNLDWLRARLRSYPDQTLLANLLEGVRLDADVELQSVFIPHLASLPLGFASVEKELRRLHGKGWYDFFPDLPFWPIYLNGQGATARKLEPDRFRRTTEGGGPRHPTYDESGFRALSLNEASHIHHVSRHFSNDPRPEMTAWLRARGLLPAPTDGQRSEKSKWPRERKPQLSAVMRDMAILRRAAHLLNEPIYVFGDDAKDYFNQLTMASSELHKLGIVFLAHEGEASDAPPHAPEHSVTRPIFVSEKRLGFGTHGASNIAQRFSNALLDIFRDSMDELEAAHRASHPSPQLDAWLEGRCSASQGKAATSRGVTRLPTKPAPTLQPRLCAPSSASTRRICSPTTPSGS